MNSLIDLPLEMMQDRRIWKLVAGGCNCSGERESRLENGEWGMGKENGEMTKKKGKTENKQINEEVGVRFGCRILDATVSCFVSL